MVSKIDSSSIVISQIGFAAAYIVFTSENLRAFTANVSSYDVTDINIVWFILLQVVIIVPLSLIRDITKLSLSAVFANVFILTGLVTIVYFMLYQWLGVNHGIGLIIPIQESMIHPNNFPRVLGQVILTIAVIMIMVGSLGYLTFGDKIKTVVLLNLPQDSPMVIITQLLYSLAILLSTPLQLFSPLDYWNRK
ncbi:Transmembrane amino acid transporter family protein [Candida albicans]|uniref:Transmembrane amino acid transporter family protein n=1 Tax=Candida albicans TaxID=5476 RepID=A0A8H6BYS8_CANAX|nr:Transmembrane amino acid transporter family protein [Candida albicans]